MKYFYEFAGWYGALAIILAYFLNSYSVLGSTNLTYQMLNLTGAIGIVIISAYKRTYQAVALNSIWCLIALFAVIKILV